MTNNLDDLSICKELTSKIANLIDDKDLIENFSSTPKDVMEYALAKTNWTTKKDFASQVGLWEGFTLGEHTESVMLFFQENFVNKLPCDKTTKAIIDLIIFCHDIGKVQEKELESFGKKLSFQYKFEIYNQKTLAFLNDFKLKEKNKLILSYLITSIAKKLEQLTTSYYVLDNDGALPTLDEYSQKLLVGCGFEGTKTETDGLTTIARILQTCDGGAYTIYGKTRDERTNTYHYNYNTDWSLGFILTKNGYRFKKDAKKISFEKDEISLWYIIIISFFSNF